MYKYKQNLKVTNNSVYSYDTKVAEINHYNKEILPIKWSVYFKGRRNTSSATTTKHINHVASVLGYTVNKKEYIKNL